MLIKILWMALIIIWFAVIAVKTLINKSNPYLNGSKKERRGIKR